MSTFPNSVKNHPSIYGPLQHLLLSGFGREPGSMQVWAGQHDSALQLICFAYSLPLGAIERQFNIKHTENQISYFTDLSSFLVQLGHKRWLCELSVCLLHVITSFFCYCFYGFALLLPSSVTTEIRYFYRWARGLTLTVCTVSWCTGT